MSGDEAVVFLASLALGPGAWILWAFRTAAIPRFGARLSPVWWFLGAVGGSTAIIATVIALGSSPDVRNAPPYFALYLALGIAWMRGGEFLFAYAGISVRDDAIERDNPSALFAAIGAIAGVACCYAGANVGAGPGWPVVVFCAALATGALGVVWTTLDAVTNINDAVTIDRDPASGIRLGGLLAAIGLISGRAVAGDWHSIGGTLMDFGRTAWVVLPMLAMAVAIERSIEPSVTSPRPAAGRAGLGPAVLYVGAAVVYVRFLGWPS